MLLLQSYSVECLLTKHQNKMLAEIGQSIHNES